MSDGDGGSGDEWQGDVRWVQKDSHCLFFFVVRDDTLFSLLFSFLQVLILFRSLCFTSLSLSSSLVPVDCVSDGDGGSGDEWQGDVRWVQKDSHCLFFFDVRGDTVRGGTCNCAW